MPKNALKEKDLIFSNNLAIFRKSLNLTQNEIADSLRINRATYAKWELGYAEPSFNMIRKLVKLYNTDYNSLFEEPQKNK